MSNLSSREESRSGYAVSRERAPAWRRRTIACGGVLLAAASALLGAGGGSSAVAATPSLHRIAEVALAPKLGKWTALKPLPGASTQGGAPAVWVGPGHEGFVVWPVQFSNGTARSTYEAATIAASGSVAPPVNVFGARWSALEDSPTLVAKGSEPLLVLSGSRNASSSDPYRFGCVVGTAFKGSWALQSWSLSGTDDNCNGISGSPAAAESPNGVLSAAWVNGSSVYYRIGTSPTIPATGSDSSIHLKAWYPYYVGEASDGSSGHFYVAWTQGGSNVQSQDGFYVADVSAHGPTEKAPGSGNNSVGESINQGGRVAITSTNSHGGVFMVYCSNAAKCQLLLWRVGAKHAITVPGSLNGALPQVAEGPDGRVWIAWITPQDSRLFVVRSNKADTGFGPVEGYKVPFPYGYNSIGLGGGSWGRLDVALSCLNNKSQLQVFTTQVMVPLQLSIGSTVIVNDHANSVVFKVRDAGDPVAGAKVVVDGKSAVTNASGNATIAFPKAAGTGTYTVTASAPEYLPAHGHLTIKS